MFDKVFELSLSRNYVRHWGIIEGVREIIQNALDSDSPFQYEIDSEDDGTYTLYLVSEFSTLPTSTLLLGSTSKADSTDKIGSFGEGYKIALLVLTREGIRTAIWNGPKKWEPFFQHSTKFNEELLCVRETAMPSKNRGLRFCIYGLSSDQVDDIRASCIRMQDHIGAIRSTPKGDILLEQPGKLYVGGLFICNTELQFGYNIKPDFVTLERDRQTVDGWALKTLTRDMWFDTGDMDRIVTLISEEVPDLEYAEYSSPEIVKDACYRHFREQHGDQAIIAKTPADLKQLIKEGMTRVVSAGVLGSVASGSELYRQRRLVVVKSPKDYLDEWWSKAKFNIHERHKAGFEEILRQSKKWSTK